VTTEGFADAVEIGRQDRPDLYDLSAEKPDPLVPPERRYELAERATGVRTPSRATRRAGVGEPRGARGVPGALAAGAFSGRTRHCAQKRLDSRRLKHDYSGRLEHDNS